MNGAFFRYAHFLLLTAFGRAGRNFSAFLTLLTRALRRRWRKRLTTVLRTTTLILGLHKSLTWSAFDWLVDESTVFLGILAFKLLAATVIDFDFYLTFTALDILYFGAYFPYATVFLTFAFSVRNVFFFLLVFLADDVLIWLFAIAV